MVVPKQQNSLQGRVVWILNHYACSPDMPGGTRHFELARYLASYGYDVTIIASSFHYMLHRELRLGEKEDWRLESIEGVKFLWVRTFRYAANNWRRMVNMLSYSWRAYRLGSHTQSWDPGACPPDLLIGSSVHPFAVFVALRLAKRYKSHFMMEVRDLWPQVAVDMGQLSRKHPITLALRRLERYLYKQAERIVIAHPGDVGYISGLGVPEEKITAIPHWAEVGSLAQVATYTKDPDTFTVMYAGSHGTSNALDMVLRAAQIVQEQNPAIRFCFVGEGPEKPNLVQLSHSLNLANVRFRDPVPKQAIPDVLASADAFVVALLDIPTFDTGTSQNKFSSYMAAAKPIVLSGNLPQDIVKDANCGISVPAQDPVALAQAILSLAGMTPAQREAMGLRGRQYVQDHLSIDVLGERFRQCIQEVLSPSET